MSEKLEFKNKLSYLQTQGYIKDEEVCQLEEMMDEQGLDAATVELNELLKYWKEN